MRILRVFDGPLARLFRRGFSAQSQEPLHGKRLRRRGDSEYRALGLDVLRLEGGLVVEITRFVRADLFYAFGLPPTL